MSTRSEPADAALARMGRISVIGLFVLAVIYTLHFARDLLLPITLAVIFALLLSPGVEFAVRYRVPRALASLLAVLLLAATAGASLYALSTPAAQWVQRLPEVREELVSHIGDVREDIEGVGDATREIEALADEITRSEGDTAGRDAAREVRVIASEPSLQHELWVATGRFLSLTLLSLILLFFLLSSGEQVIRRVIDRQARPADRRAVIALLRRAQGQMSRYLVTITAVNLLVGACATVGLWLLGIPNPLLWGALAAMLRFVPYLGAAITVALLLVVSSVTHDSLPMVLAAPAAYLCLPSLVGQLVDPLVHGYRFTLNPIVVFVSIFFWGWLWGAAGILLAVPLLTLMKVVCEQHETLRPIAQLVSTGPRHGQT